MHLAGERRRPATGKMCWVQWEGRDDGFGAAKARNDGGSLTSGKVPFEKTLELRSAKAWWQREERWLGRGGGSGKEKTERGRL